MNQSDADLPNNIKANSTSIIRTPFNLFINTYARSTQYIAKEHDQQISFDSIKHSTGEESKIVLHPAEFIQYGTKLHLDRIDQN